VANELLRQDSTNVEAIFVRGLCLYYEDNLDKAFTHFQQVLRLAPDHERAKDAFKVINKSNKVIQLACKIKAFIMIKASKSPSTKER